MTAINQAIEPQLVRSATVTAPSEMTMVEIEDISLCHASGGLQAYFSNAFLKTMISRLKNVDKRFIASAFAASA